MLVENPAAQWWEKDYFTDAAEFLFKKGAWLSAHGKIPGPADAVDTSGIKTAATRSISRIEAADDTNTAADWYISGTGKASPGQPNL